MDARHCPPSSYSITETAQQLGLGRVRVWQLIKRSSLPAQRIGLPVGYQRTRRLAALQALESWQRGVRWQRPATHAMTIGAVPRSSSSSHRLGVGSGRVAACPAQALPGDLATAADRLPASATRPGGARPASVRDMASRVSSRSCSSTDSSPRTAVRSERCAGHGHVPGPSASTGASDDGGRSSGFWERVSIGVAHPPTTLPEQRS